MKESIIKFVVDVLTAGVAGASGVLAVTDLDAVSPKVLAVALAIGFVNGAINALRRYALTKVA